MDYTPAIDLPKRRQRIPSSKVAFRYTRTLVKQGNVKERRNQIPKMTKPTTLAEWLRDFTRSSWKGNTFCSWRFSCTFSRIKLFPEPLLEEQGNVWFLRFDMYPVLAKELSKAHCKVITGLVIRIEFDAKRIGAGQNEHISLGMRWCRWSPSWWLHCH